MFVFNHGPLVIVLMGVFAVAVLGYGIFTGRIGHQHDPIQSSTVTVNGQTYACAVTRRGDALSCDWAHPIR